MLWGKREKCVKDARKAKLSPIVAIYRLIFKHSPNKVVVKSNFFVSFWIIHWVLNAGHHNWRCLKIWSQLEVMCMILFLRFFLTFSFNREFMITLPNSSKFVKTSHLCVVFSTLFSVFRNVSQHSPSCLMYYVKQKIIRSGNSHSLGWLITKRNQDWTKSVTSGSNKLKKIESSNF